MNYVAILFLLLNATASYASIYDLSSNEAQAIKANNTQAPQVSATLNQDTKAFAKLPKIEDKTSIIAADLLDMGGLKVTKKICVHAEGTEINTNAFSYDVNIGIKVIFI